MRLIVFLIISLYALQGYSNDTCSPGSIKKEINSTYIISDAQYVDCYIKLYGEEAISSSLVSEVGRSNGESYKAIKHLYYYRYDLLSSQIKDSLRKALAADTLNILSVFSESPLIFIACGISEGLSYDFSMASIYDRQQALGSILIEKDKHNAKVMASANYCALYLDFELKELQENNSKIDSDQWGHPGLPPHK